MNMWPVFAKETGGQITRNKRDKSMSRDTWIAIWTSTTIMIRDHHLSSAI